MKKILWSKKHKILILFTWLILNGCSCILGSPMSCADYEIVNLLQFDKVDVMIGKERPISTNSSFFTMHYNKHQSNKSIFVTFCRRTAPQKYRYLIEQNCFTKPTHRPTYDNIDKIVVKYQKNGCKLYDFGQYDIEDVLRRYDQDRENKILALTKNGLEVISKEEFEKNKEKYVMSEKDIKCLNEK